MSLAGVGTPAPLQSPALPAELTSGYVAVVVLGDYVAAAAARQFRCLLELEDGVAAAAAAV